MSIRIVPIPRITRRSLVESALKQRWRQFGKHWHLLSLTAAAGVLMAAAANTPVDPDGPKEETVVPAVAPVVPAPAPRAAETAKPAALLRLAGHTIAKCDLNVYPKVTGEVATVNVDVGDLVKAGDVIAELNSTDEQRALRRAQIALQTSQARLAQARENMTIAERSLSTGRARSLAQIKAAEARSRRARIRADRLKQTLQFTSQEEYDSRETEATEASANLDIVRLTAEDLKTQELALDVKKQDVRCAEAQVEMDEVAVAATQQRLADMKILAPCDGVITAAPTHSRQIVTAAATAMFSISDVTRLYVVSMVDENSLCRIATGQTVVLTSDALSGKTLTGLVDRIAPRGVRNDNKVCFEVRVEVNDAPKSGLRPEMTCNVEISCGCK